MNDHPHPRGTPAREEPWTSEPKTKNNNAAVPSTRIPHLSGMILDQPTLVLPPQSPPPTNSTFNQYSFSAPASPAGSSIVSPKEGSAVGQRRRAEHDPEIHVSLRRLSAGHGSGSSLSASGGGRGGASSTGETSAAGSTWSVPKFPAPADISAEFALLESLAPKESMSSFCDVMTRYPSAAANFAKNRWRDVLPHEHTRVQLGPWPGAPTDVPCSDYINANLIVPPPLPPHHQQQAAETPLQQYIAAQAPIPETLEDFWRMLWTQRVACVVMLTRLREQGKQKASVYWSESASTPLQAGPLLVTLLRVDSLAGGALLARLLRLTLAGETRELVQLHYLEWPDFGVPTSTHALRLLLHQLEQVQQQHTPPGQPPPPLVVHCSAGIGRSGTLIAIHMALQRMARGAEIDVPLSVQRMREQRRGMVQNEDQYAFIYRVLKDVANERVQLERVRRLIGAHADLEHTRIRKQLSMPLARSVGSTRRRTDKATPLSMSLGSPLVPAQHHPHPYHQQQHLQPHSLQPFAPASLPKAQSQPLLTSPSAGSVPAEVPLVSTSPASSQRALQPLAQHRSERPASPPVAAPPIAQSSSGSSLHAMAPAALMAGLKKSFDALATHLHRP